MAMIQNDQSPAACGGRLFIKGRNHLWCIGAR
jgi:hypothetical protein